MTAAGARPPAFRERVEERWVLVEELRRHGITSEEVLDAMAAVPRHAFVPPDSLPLAYADIALPLAWGQTVSQPFVVASMTEQIQPRRGTKCLEIGTGSGYQAAVLAEVCGEVFSVEVVPELCELSRRHLRALGYGPDRVHLRCGDGSQGWPEEAPWDGIVVTAAPAHVPPALLHQLAVGGRLVVPLGETTGWQQLEVWERTRPGDDLDAFRRDVLFGVRFVPLVSGKQGSS